MVEKTNQYGHKYKEYKEDSYKTWPLRGKTKLFGTFVNIELKKKTIIFHLYIIYLCIFILKNTI